MAFNPQYLITLNLIISDIDSGHIVGPNQAIPKFQSFINAVKNIGRYSDVDWNNEFIERIYEFGTKFSKIDPTPFLSLLDIEINNSTFAENEILHFIKSEILWSFEKHQNQENYLTNLHTQYGSNPEFRQSLANVKLDNRQFDEALLYYNQNVQINPSKRFLDAKFEAEVYYVECLIEDEKYTKAEKIVDENISSKIYIHDFIRHNWLVFLNKRIKDYKLQEQKATKRDLELKKLLDTEFQSERRKVIELLGLFTAIIAFIFTTVSIAKTFEYQQAISFISCLGLVLVDFAIVISIIFHDKNIPIHKDVRLYATLTISIAICLIIHLTSN